jgi:Adenylate and Guanylate cyclase catalytic domain
MGLNSGEVVVGKIGDDLRMDYTAQGHTVGLAARMEQIAAADSIYLSEHTAKLVPGYFALRDLGETRIRGSSDPVMSLLLWLDSETRGRPVGKRNDRPVWSVTVDAALDLVASARELVRSEPCGCLAVVPSPDQPPAVRRAWTMVMPRVFWTLP